VLEPGEHYFPFGELKPGDEIRVSIMVEYSKQLVDPPKFGCHWRGSADVDVSQEHASRQTNMDTDIAAALSLLPLFVLAGSIPVIGTILEAGVLFMATPLLAKLINRSRMADGNSVTTSINVSGGDLYLERIPALGDRTNSPTSKKSIE